MPVVKPECVLVGIAGGGECLRREVGPTVGKERGASEHAGVILVARRRGMGKAEGPRCDGLRQRPDHHFILTRFLVRDRAILEPLGGNPFGIVGEVAGICGVGLENAHLAAASGQDRANVHGLFKADPQVADAGCL